MKILSFILLIHLSFSAFSDTNRAYKNQSFNFQFILPDNLCIVKNSDAQLYLFDKDINKNRIDTDWKKPELINSGNIYGEITVFKNIEFIDNSLDGYLENLTNEPDNWSIDYKYKTWTLIQAIKVEINKHEFIKESLIKFP